MWLDTESLGPLVRFCYSPFDLNVRALHFSVSRFGLNLTIKLATLFLIPAVGAIVAALETAIQ